MHMAIKVLGISRAIAIISSAARPSLAENETFLQSFCFISSTFIARYVTVSARIVVMSEFYLTGTIKTVTGPTRNQRTAVNTDQVYFEIEILGHLFDVRQNAFRQLGTIKRNDDALM